MRRRRRSPSPPTPGPEVQQHRERWRRWCSGALSRGLLSAFLAVTVSAMVISSLPDSGLRRSARPLVAPYLNATGLAQRWSMFAPDPPSRSTRLVALVHYADGSTAWWQPPHDKGPLGATRSYRWRKWSFATLDDDQVALRAATVAWIARRQDHGDRVPVRVELVRQWQDIAAPGQEPDRTWRQVTYFAADLTAGVRS